MLIVQLLAALALVPQDEADAIAKTLSTTTVTVSFKAVPLKEALETTLEKARLEAAVDPDVARDPFFQSAPVTFTVTDLRVRSVLRLLLKPRGFTLVLREGALTVVREEAARPPERMEKYNTAGLVRRLNTEARRPDIEERRRAFEREAEEVGRKWRLYPQEGIPEPEIGVVSDGVVLDVRPIVLPGRRYVMLDMRPINAQLQLPLGRIQIPVFMAGGVGPPTTDPAFGQALLQELLAAHTEGQAAAVDGNLWVRTTESEHRRIERFLRLLAAMK